MPLIAQFLRRPWTGAKIMLLSLAIGVAGVLPLLLYAVLGPEDGNPIGLGLLMVAAVPVAGLGLVIGFIRLVIEQFTSRRR